MVEQTNPTQLSPEEYEDSELLEIDKDHEWLLQTDEKPDN